MLERDETKCCGVWPESLGEAFARVSRGERFSGIPLPSSPSSPGRLPFVAHPSLTSFPHRLQGLLFILSVRPPAVTAGGHPSPSTLHLSPVVLSLLTLSVIPSCRLPLDLVLSGLLLFQDLTPLPPESHLAPSSLLLSCGLLSFQSAEAPPPAWEDRHWQGKARDSFPSQLLCAEETVLERKSWSGAAVVCGRLRESPEHSPQKGLCGSFSSCNPILSH